MLLRLARFLAVFLLAAAAGLATDSAFPQRGIWPLAFLGVTVLVLVTTGDRARRNAAMAFGWGLGFFLPHLWWADYVVGPIPWALLAVAESGIIAFGVACFTWMRKARWLRERRLWAPLVFGLAWVVTEQLRQVWPFGGFPWGRLAFSQTNSPLLSLASIGGAPLVSFAVAAIGYLIAQGLRQGWRSFTGRSHREGTPSWRPPVVRLAGAVVAVALCAAIPLPSNEAEDGELRVGAVQGNVAEPGLGAFANAREVLNNHAEGTRELARLVPPGYLDLVVWPENASDINPRRDGQAASIVNGAARAVQAPILFGTDRYGKTAQGKDARYNEMVLWEPSKGAVFAYAKQIPAAFAEYIPLRDLARKVSSAVDLVPVDMARGQKIAVVPVDVPRLNRVVEVGTIICFEVAYDALIRQSVLGGSEILFVPTNNASFGYTAESEQQLAMSRLRAVEHGRATVQISTVGVSAVILPDGTMMDKTGLFTHEFFEQTLPLRSTLTIADRLGDWPMIIATILAVLALMVGVATGRRKKTAEARGDTDAKAPASSFGSAGGAQ